MVRHPAHLIITGYAIQAADSYCDETRETLDIVGNGNQIIDALDAWICQRHREARNGSQFAKQDLERLAGSMGLSYGVNTAEV